MERLISSMCFPNSVYGLFGKHENTAISNFKESGRNDRKIRSPDIQMKIDGCGKFLVCNFSGQCMKRMQ